MALGSSAPEILLNVVEITTGKFMAGALGPSTIVGSAAFNLLVILGVCVGAITEGTRRIEEMKAPAPPLHIPPYPRLHPLCTPVAPSVPHCTPLWHPSPTSLAPAAPSLHIRAAAHAPYPPSSPRLSPTALHASAQVYALTAVTSMFAYIWLLIMLMVWTPDRITVAEGCAAPAALRSNPSRAWPRLAM